MLLRLHQPGGLRQFINKEPQRLADICRSLIPGDHTVLQTCHQLIKREHRCIYLTPLYRLLLLSDTLAARWYAGHVISLYFYCS